MQALLTSTSRRPYDARAASTRICPPSGRLTSAATPTASCPAATISSAASFARPSSRELTTTRAPPAASRPAMALPMPELEPVTIATRPATDAAGGCGCAVVKGWPF
jgi:hypothetical protein